jgi:glutaredoxin
MALSIIGVDIGRHAFWLRYVEEGTWGMKMARLHLSLLFLVLISLTTAVRAGEHYTARTDSLDYEEGADSAVTLFWEGEVYNDTVADATLQVVLEFRDSSDNTLITLESGTINVERFATITLTETFTVDAGLWADVEMLYERAQWSYKTPINGQRVKRVELFSASWCSYCLEAAEYLDAQGVAYVDHDIEEDDTAMERLQRYNSDNSVPTLVIDGDRIHVGFSEEGYAKLLNPGMM